MKSRVQKEQDLSSLNKSMEAAQIAVCADYMGLTVKQVTELRRELKKSGGEAVVMKNTLAKIAAKNVLKDMPAADMEKFLGLFEGPSMLIFGQNDAIGPAKVIAKYAKDLEKFKVKGGVFSGAFVDANGVDAVSKLPSREELLSTLLRLINTPATQLVRLLATPAQQVVQVVDAQRQKLS